MLEKVHFCVLGGKCFYLWQMVRQPSGARKWPNSHRERLQFPVCFHTPHTIASLFLARWLSLLKRNYFFILVHPAESINDMRNVEAKRIWLYDKELAWWPRVSGETLPRLYFTTSCLLHTRYWSILIFSDETIENSCSLLITTTTHYLIYNQLSSACAHSSSWYIFICFISTKSKSKISANKLYSLPSHPLSCKYPFKYCTFFCPRLFVLIFLICLFLGLYFDI